MKLIGQYVFSNMLNVALEKNHEEMYEMHFKHDLMEHQLVRKKHSVQSAQALMQKLKLIMACDDPNYRTTLENDGADDEYDMGAGLGGGRGLRRGETRTSPSVGNRMTTKTNFWGEGYEVPLCHSYSTKEDLTEARLHLKRWNAEWREKKIIEMETFIGKRELNVNEGETASTMSQSRVSANKTDKAQQLAKDAQRRFGSSGTKKDRAGGGPKVGFADEPQSPTAARHEMREGLDSDGKAEIREIDKILQGYQDDMENDTGDIPEVKNLKELSKSKSRVLRDDEAL